MFTSIANGMLVFLGLVTAAAASILAAADKVIAHVSMRWLLGGSATLALLAGVLVLAMMTEAHRYDRLRETSRRETDELKQARKAAADLGTAVNLTALASAACLVVGLAIFILSPTAAPPVVTPPPTEASSIDIMVNQICLPVSEAPDPAPFCK